jgi:V/A-type H+-transporting ATPase subunit D
MREGYAFLDEKCLLLAGEIVVELGRYAAAARDVRDASAEATRALVAAVARHGLEGLQVHPAGDLGGAHLEQRRRSLMGVPLADATFSSPQAIHAAAVDASPEARRCRIACMTLVERATALGSTVGNLERLSADYQRSLRRARALDDVLLPDISRTADELETRLEELEREEAMSMSRAAGTPANAAA